MSSVEWNHAVVIFNRIVNFSCFFLFKKQSKLVQKRYFNAAFFQFGAGFYRLTVFLISFEQIHYDSSRTRQDEPLQQNKRWFKGWQLQ